MFMLVVVQLFEILIQVICFPSDHLLQLRSGEQSRLLLGSSCVDVYVHSLNAPTGMCKDTA